MSKKLLVVLGMHRSGTSALTRGLKVLGVELGERLMPPKEGNNAKGFWEDMDVNQLNIELLQALGRSWDTLLPLTAGQCAAPEAQAFIPRAMALLQSKLQHCDCFGLKDPRISVLLPFWQQVFSELELEVRYVIALRSPLAVADSLARRDNIEAEKSHYLWLQYMLASLQHSQTAQRLVVDFDALMAQPAAQLTRIAAVLDLPFNEHSQAFVEYSGEFLESGLRHSVYSAEQTAEAATLSDTGKALYALLCRLAQNELEFGSRSYNATLARIEGEFRAQFPALCYMTRSDLRIAELEQEYVQKQALEQHARHLERHIEQLNHNIHGLAEHQKRLDQELENAHGELEHQAMQLLQRDQQLEMLVRSLSWRLTQPLRKARHHARTTHSRLQKLRRLVRQVPAQVRKSGGLGPLTGKVKAIIAREGWAGLRSRMQGRLVGSVVAADAAVAGFSADEHRRYRLNEQMDGYCYVPPAPPVDLLRRLESFGRQVLFSIVVPVYNTPPELLSKLLASVKAQWYPHWELILADDCSPDEQIRRELAAIDDERVITFCLPENRGIAGATNAALEKARGEFVVLLDHDDELTPDCLYELARCIDAENPDYIYSDEDKIDAEGRYADPHFKPDWSPDTMMSTMYVCHVSCIRRSLLEKVGGLRSEYDGCQDWDLILRVTEQTSKICHIPKVLYHWRVIEGSIATDIAAKPYVQDATVRVRQDALVRRGLAGSVEALENIPGYFRVNYHPQGEPLVSIIIPSRDNHEVLRQCIDSIWEKSTYRNLEIVVLDNGSVVPECLEYLDGLAQDERIQVVRHDAPFNFSELNNIGVRAARGEILLFLNDDTEVVAADWLERMIGYAQLPHVGAVGARLLYPRVNLIQHAGIVNLEQGPGHAFLRSATHEHGYFLRNQLEYNWLAVTGACLMVERAKFERVGGFDESFPVAYNDVDLCFSLHAAGYYQVNCQAAVLLHHESLSRGHDHLNEQKRQRLEREKQRLFIKHPQYFQHDPFHNPNLHPNGIHFELAV